MKRILPIILAAVAFIAVLLFLSPTPDETVLVAGSDMSVGHILEEKDVISKEVPSDMVPDDAVRDTNEVVGMTLSVGRSTGDIIRLSNLGTEPLTLAPSERAVAITVNNASGLAGLLRAGDYVGVTAVIEMGGTGSGGTFSKSTVENLRVLYLSPEFKSLDPDNNILTNVTENTTATAPRERRTEGAVVLAVPVDQETILYDFKNVEPELGVKQRVVNTIEMLTALDASQNAKLYLFLMPRDAEDMVTSGLWLPELVIKPYIPTPTSDVFSALTPQPASQGGP
ncbi:MAG: Flp pilus assembly protein CpaB [Anaerolineaceae bacterium]|nr:Flp pilus assembly protein CpaB [Anaerolineaceae bacterium]